MKQLILAGIILSCAICESRAQLNESDLTRKFDAYKSMWPKTRVHLTLNQEKFAPGDTVWFKAYFLKEDLTGVPGKQLIEFNLTDSQGDSRVHITFKLINGVGQNQFVIPEALPPGIYLVTAYSNWMKNFHPFPIFKKEVTVVRKNAVARDDAPVIRASVEGGHLVMNIPNKVRLETNRPRAILEIVDTLNHQIEGTTITDDYGGASVVFRPAANSHYIARLSGQPVQYELPATEEDGCSLILTPSEVKTTPVKLLVASPLPSPLRQQELSVVISCRGKICYTAKLRQGTKEIAELSIPQTDLPGGIANLSLLDSRGNLLASRDFYIAENDTIHAQIHAPKNSFVSRESVILEVSLKDSQGHPVQGEFSVCARLAEMFEHENDSTVESFSFQTNPWIVRSDPSWFSRLNSHLISATEIDPWAEILTGKFSKPTSGFSSAIEKRGVAYLGENPEPTPDFTQIMFYLQKDKMHYQTYSLGKGHVRLTMPDVYGHDEFFYVAETRRGKEIPNLKIKWEDQSNPLPAAPQSIEKEHADPYALYASKLRQINQSYEFYASQEAIGAKRTAALEPDNFEDEIGGGGDIKVDVQDYEIFPTMAEMVKEVIPSLYHRRNAGNDIVRVNLPESMHFPTGDPVYIIDEIATKNTQFFLSLKPSELRSVTIVNSPQKLAPFRLMGKNGIVIVHTVQGNAREPLRDPAKLFEGLNEPLNFREIHSARDRNQHLPYFRSTIYWNPSVKTDSNGKALVEFSCSDDVGRIRILVEGLATGGKPFSANTEIFVDEQSR